ncbi:hypothetical protein QZJ86_20310 [Methylomonas montana]|uniref:hypothetical protein n=1 Tax=Methylomonas montana TaxID=3058963 RepID=UPI0026599F18|nr:hypothetical protein [Methylomonas montana]WKJ90321.1 hypothetical protein QZJ86_20310 [Methylomonas montana]
MSTRLTLRRRSLRLFDIGAAVLFFGVFAQQTELPQAATTALSELAAQGYRIPSEDDPVRVFPALTGGDFSGHHAGGWRPGSIYLRQHPQGALSETIYLRHELFHEVSHRSCGGRMPGWAEEAAAMHFSGELADLEPSAWPSDAELQGMKTRISHGAELDANDRSLLGRLVVDAGWPKEPCSQSAKLSELLGGAFDQAGGHAYLLMSLLSGRILERGGDIDSRQPPGSLLKIPYAAALKHANPEVLSSELAASDTDKLAQRHEYFQTERYRLLLSPFREQKLPVQTTPADRQTWRTYLGERNADGDFALQSSLPELALAMRAALLSKPEYFRGLSQNGLAPSSTLFGQNAADKKLLRQLQALAKTGTVSTSDGQPLVGHLLLAWPATHPVFLAIFRQRGMSGAAVLSKAAPVLKSWQQNYPARFATVRVRLLTPTDPASWEARADCPELDGSLGRFTLCGQFHIVSTARGSRSERLVSGILRQTAGNGPTVLETDVETYVDSVLAAEAQNLTGSGREAMRAVIAWNGSHGSHRHADSGSLCDTTHCMVFLGELPSDKPRRSSRIDIELMQLLDKLAVETGLNWLPFANGGDQRWQRQISANELQHIFAENQILEIRRERRKDGALFIRLTYPDNEEAISCEVFRNTLKLPSCPDTVQNVGNQAWGFQGIGAGHGLGLSIVRAQALAEAGRSAEQILRDAYGQSR